LNQLFVKIDSKKEIGRTNTKPSSSIKSIPKANIESLPEAKGSNLDILRTISEQIKISQSLSKIRLLPTLKKLANKMTAPLPQQMKKLFLVVVTKKRL